MKIRIFAFAAFMLSALLLQAQGMYQIGDQVADFSVQGVNDQTVRLSDYSDHEGLIVVITCNHCPYAKLYEDRIIELHHAFADQGYPVLAISSNDPEKSPDDSFENLKRRSEEKSYPFMYSFDESQEVARSFGATRTPEIFLLQKGEDGAFTLQYTGAIDDNPRSADAAEKKYVEMAIKALKSGKNVDPTAVKAVGCTIKWKDS